MVHKQVRERWGRRRFDDQAYPKDRPDKSALPRGLTAVPGTRRQLRPPIQMFGISHEANVEAVGDIIDSLYPKIKHDDRLEQKLTLAVDAITEHRIQAVAASKKNRGLTKRDLEAMDDMDVAINTVMELALDKGVITQAYYDRYERDMVGPRTHPVGATERYYAFGDAAMDYLHTDVTTGADFVELSYREESTQPSDQEKVDGRGERLMASSSLHRRHREGRAVRRLEKEASLERVHDDYTVGARYPPEDFSDRREDMGAPIAFRTRKLAREDVDEWLKEGYHDDKYTRDDITIVKGRGLGDMGRWRYGWIVVKRVKGPEGRRRPER